MTPPRTQPLSRKRISFTLVARHENAELVREEARSLLGPYEIPFRLRRVNDSNPPEGRPIFRLTVQPGDAGSASQELRRMASADVTVSRSRRLINKYPMAAQSSDMVSPYFSMAGRFEYFKTPIRGTTSAQHAATMVNLLGIWGPGRVLVPMHGFGYEALAAAFAGHKVLAGDISEWLWINKPRMNLYLGKRPFPLRQSDEAKLAESLAKLRQRGLPTSHLSNIEWVRWDARKLPLKPGKKFDGAVFDPPFGKHFKFGNEKELAREVLYESSRHVKDGGSVVLRVPLEWAAALEHSSERLRHVGTYPIGKKLALLKFIKKEA